jgi:hypothetical protein
MALLLAALVVVTAATLATTGATAERAAILSFTVFGGEAGWWVR